MIDSAELLAQLAANLSDGDRALSDAIEKHPDEPVAFVARARFRYESALSLGTPGMAQAVAEATGMDYFRGALDDYTRVIELSEALSEEHADAVLCECFLNIASILMRLGALGPSCDAATLAIERVSDRADGDPLKRRVLAQGHKARGTARHLQGLVAEAVEDYGPALQLDPEDGETASNRGEALVTLGRFADAVADFDRAVELGHAHPLTYCGRAMAQEGLGLPERALEDYARALALDENNEQARSGLERLRAAASGDGQ
ncbi:MAG: hypothetical protein HOW73_12015 [Polyangiaceae bacterium]|nr:hypothetical protein [Polyangiaceae bacterium]